MAKPEDIFNLLQIAGHPMGKSEWAFRFRYCGFFENEYGKIERGEPQHLDELKENLKGFMIRRLKRDVLKFLPPKTRELRDIEVQDEYLELLISAEGYAAKKRKVSEKKKWLFETHDIDIDNMSAIRSELAKLKAPHAVERIEEMMQEVDCLVVFWCHKDPLYYCVEHLEKYNPVFVNGDIKIEERQANVDKFQSGESKIIFLTYAAGAEGITLTRASHMLMCELDWTPSKMLQAEDRTNRIGQQNAVRIEYLTFENSLDHKILTTVMDKTDIIAQIIDGENLSSLVDVY
jgi:SNF2 family DNA or RNA helicase